MLKHVQPIEGETIFLVMGPKVENMRGIERQSEPFEALLRQYNDVFEESYGLPNPEPLIMQSPWWKRESQ